VELGRSAQERMGVTTVPVIAGVREYPATGEYISMGKPKMLPSGFQTTSLSSQALSGGSSAWDRGGSGRANLRFRSIPP